MGLKDYKLNVKDQKVYMGKCKGSKIDFSLKFSQMFIYFVKQFYINTTYIICIYYACTVSI